MFKLLSKPSNKRKSGDCGSGKPEKRRAKDDTPHAYCRIALRAYLNHNCVGPDHLLAADDFEKISPHFTKKQSFFSLIAEIRHNKYKTPFTYNGHVVSFRSENPDNANTKAGTTKIYYYLDISDPEHPVLVEKIVKEKKPRDKQLDRLIEYLLSCTEEAPFCSKNFEKITEAESDTPLFREKRYLTQAMKKISDLAKNNALKSKDGTAIKLKENNPDNLHLVRPNVQYIMYFDATTNELVKTLYQESPDHKRRLIEKIRTLTEETAMSPTQLATELNMSSSHANALLTSLDAIQFGASQPAHKTRYFYHDPTLGIVYRTENTNPITTGDLLEFLKDHPDTYFTSVDLIDHFKKNGYPDFSMERFKGTMHQLKIERIGDSFRRLYYYDTEQKCIKTISKLPDRTYVENCIQHISSQENPCTIDDIVNEINSALTNWTPEKVAKLIRHKTPVSIDIIRSKHTTFYWNDTTNKIEIISPLPVCESTQAPQLEAPPRFPQNISTLGNAVLDKVFELKNKASENIIAFDTLFQLAGFHPPDTIEHVAKYLETTHSNIKFSPKQIARLTAHASSFNDQAPCESLAIPECQQFVVSTDLSPKLLSSTAIHELSPGTQQTHQGDYPRDWLLETPSGLSMINIDGMTSSSFSIFSGFYDGLSKYTHLKDVYQSNRPGHTLQAIAKPSKRTQGNLKTTFETKIPFWIEEGDLLRVRNTDGKTTHALVGIKVFASAALCNLSRSDKIHPYMLGFAKHLQKAPSIIPVSELPKPIQNCMEIIGNGLSYKKFTEVISSNTAVKDTFLNIKNTMNKKDIPDFLNDSNLDLFFIHAMKYFLDTLANTFQIDPNNIGVIPHHEYHLDMLGSELGDHIVLHPSIMDFSNYSPRFQDNMAHFKDYLIPADINDPNDGILNTCLFRQGENVFILAAVREDIETETYLAKIWDLIEAFRKLINAKNIHYIPVYGSFNDNTGGIRCSTLQIPSSRI